MRIVTWNCCRGPATKKLPALGLLNPTLSIVQECPRIPSEGKSALWFGDNPRQGIAVLSSGEYSISPIEACEVPRFTIPIQVTGPHSFLLLAVWAKADPNFRYVRAVIRAIECYRDLIVAQPTVLVGDFNSNKIWDYKRPDGRNHSGLVRELEALGLRSAYHEFHTEAQGKETRPTLFLLRQATRPYHIDYCFVPESWVAHIRSVDVGTDDPWALYSDHRPLVVDVELPNARAKGDDAC